MQGKKKIIIISIAAAGALLFALATFLLIKGIRGLSTAELELRSSTSKWKSFYKKKPFPSVENVKTENENVVLLEKEYDRMIALLSKGQIDPGTDKRPPQFMTRLQKKKQVLTSRMKKAEIRVPEEFSFGFDVYFSTATLPGTEDVPRLTQQLNMIEKICEVLIEEGISGVESISREVFEERTGPPLKLDRFASEMQMAEGAESGAGQSQQNVLPVEDFYSIQHFVFSFAAKESAFLKVLNRLSNHKTFMHVTSVVVDNEKEDLKKTKMLGDTSTEEDEESIDENSIVRRKSRIVSGPEVEKPLNVSLFIDVYNFVVPESDGVSEVGSPDAGSK